MRKLLLALTVLTVMTTMMLTPVSAQDATTTTTMMMASSKAEEVMLNLVRRPEPQVFAPEGGAISLAFRAQLSGAAQWRGELTVTEVGMDGRRRLVAACREDSTNKDQRRLVCESQNDRRQFSLTGHDTLVEVKVKECATRSDTGIAYRVAIDGRLVSITKLYVINNDHVDVAVQNEAVVRWYFRMLALLFLVMFVVAIAAYHAVKRAQRRERMERLKSQQTVRSVRRTQDDNGKGLPSYVELFSVAHNKNNVSMV